MCVWRKNKDLYINTCVNNKLQICMHVCMYVCMSVQ